jgi:hypothetical protein
MADIKTSSNNQCGENADREVSGSIKGIYGT